MNDEVYDNETVISLFIKYLCLNMAVQCKFILE